MHNRRAAVALQFQYVFPGVRVRSREIKRDTLVDNAAVIADEVVEAGVTGFGEFAQNRYGEICQIVAGDANDANTATAWRRCNGCNCVGVKKTLIN